MLVEEKEYCNRYVQALNATADSAHTLVVKRVALLVVFVAEQCVAGQRFAGQNALVQHGDADALKTPLKSLAHG